MSLLSVVCCQVEVSASGRSLVQRSLTDCGVSEYDRKASIMRGSWPTGGCCVMEEKQSVSFTEINICSYNIIELAIVLRPISDIKNTRDLPPPALLTNEIRFSKRPTSPPLMPTARIVYTTLQEMSWVLVCSC